MSNNEIFKRFSSMCKKILVSSQRIAEKSGSGIGSEHLLLALVATPNTIAYDLLREHNIHLDQVRLVINFNNLKTTLPKGLSSEVINIIETATAKSSKLKQSKIESEHLLWAISQKEDSLAYQILLRMGINPEDICDDLEMLFSNSTIQSRPEINFDNFPIMPPMGFSGMDPYGIPVLENKPKNRSQTPLLDEFGSDLVAQSKAGKLDPVIGREKEIQRAIQILCRRTKNNPVLVGDPGVGKTAIVEGIAHKIASNSVPDQLKNKKVISLDLSMIVAGTMYRGQFEDRLKKIIQEILKSGNIIIFIDEIHSVIGAGSAEGSMDAANILKPQLSKGQIRLIGATTSQEYRKYIEKDPALERRLQKIDVLEPSSKEAIEILKGISIKFEEFHNVKISSNAINSAVKLSKRYIPDRFLPDKAIDLIDEAASAIHLKQNYNLSKKSNIIQNELSLLIKEKEESIKLQDFDRAALLHQKEIELKDEIKKVIEKKPLTQIKIISELDVANVVSIWTGIPMTNLLESEKLILNNLDNKLKKHLVGQDEAIGIITHAIKRSRAGISNPKRPIGAFIFLGPTGVGKTELAKLLAENVFGSEENLIKIDMSEFMEKHNVSSLVGAPPGYVGYEEAGKLTELVRKKPYSVILFDEIEKANPEVFNILLQVLEDGTLSDAKGKKINFKNTIIIMTSNIGVAELSKEAAVGFKSQDNKEKINFQKRYQEIKDRVLLELKDSFKPEFLNRLDKIIVFRPLDVNSISKISNIQIAELQKRLASEGYLIKISKNVINYIATKSYDPNFGARTVRRTIIDKIENPLSDMIISNKVIKNQKVLIDLKNNKLVFNT